MTRLSHARVSGGAGDAVGCRMLWASVVMQALLEYWREHRAELRSGTPHRVLDRASRYFRSADGRQVLSMAGVDPTERVQAALLAIVSGPTTPTRLFTEAFHTLSED